MSAEGREGSPPPGRVRVTELALVTAARLLERKLAARRRLLVKVRAFDDEIRTQRKLIRDLTTPLPGGVYAPLADPAPSCADHRFGDRGICFTCGQAREDPAAALPNPHPSALYSSDWGRPPGDPR